MELVNVNPVYAAPTVMDRAYVDGSLQGTGSVGYAPAGTSVVGTAQLVPVSAPEAATAVVPVGPADLVPAQTGFQVSSVGYVLASYVSLGLGQRVPTPVVSTVGSMDLVPAYAGPVGYVTTAPTTVVSSTVPTLDMDLVAYGRRHPFQLVLLAWERPALDRYL